MALLKLNKAGEKLNQLRKMFLFGARWSSESYIRQLNRLGARIDESARIAMPETVYLDDNSPYMLEIGKNVRIAAGVTILTHDACWLVLKENDGEIRGHVAPVKIGNNVFIGMHSTIFCNVTICDNVIISAGSVVTSHIKKPGVYTGNPAKFVASCDTYAAVRDSRQVKEAYEIARHYYTRYEKKPPQEIFNEYFWIFSPRKMEDLPKAFIKQMENDGTYQKSVQAFLSSEPDFDGYEAFWAWCMDRMVKKECQESTKS